MNMKQWCQDLMSAQKKKACPVLSFPSIQMMGITVRELINDSDLQAKGMKLISEKVPLGASFALMDLSVEAEAFGSTIHVSDDEVPTVVGKILEEPEDADALQVPEIGAGRTGLYIESVKKACEIITDVPVFAGTIGPFSLAGRLMGMSDIMIYCYDEPEMVETTMEKATEFLIKYINEYKAAGANGVCIAEPAAGLLSKGLVEEFAVPYIKRLIDAVQDDNFAVVLHNCGNSVVHWLDSWSQCGAMAYHFGNAVDMEAIMKGMPSDVICMGNVDPASQFRNGNPESVYAKTIEVMEKCCAYPNFVISSGCDIPPLSSWDNINSFFKAVDDYYAK